tara:strand:+ start:786 stop:1586 length:801 start_codon:yes stop_codon:yes gene_type:complete
MKKILAFFGIGIVILLLDLVLNYDEDELNIFISDQEIESLIYAWEMQVGKSPTRRDIKNIIDDVIKEEILYREALRLNLDLEDRIIKRRLAQKISFLREETSIAPPKLEELQIFFEKNIEAYIFPERFTFTHLYFSSERNGEQRAEEALKKFKEDTLPKSDPFMLGKNFVEKSRFEIQRDFGNQFTKIFDELVFDSWIGPVESAYGFHLVKLLNKVESVTPKLSQVKEKVEVDFYLEEKQKTLDSYLVELRDKYQVIINPKYIFND